MTEVLHSPSHFSASSSPTRRERNSNNSSSSSSSFEGEGEREEESQRDRDQQQLSLLALLVTLFRKSLVSCKADRRDLCSSMEIGWPTDVRHVAHVTFDRFNGFLGLPDEFEPEVPRRPPSASTTVFGVSTESMQLSYDSRGNSVPTILLLMQRHLYAQGGLRAEGIFRINAENSQEEFVRNQLNGGVIPDGIDVHCLAGLIKAWFRELPNGILDSLEPEQVIQCQTEEECSALVGLLPPTEAALLDWAINLMADVVQYEDHNKMNARNIAMVFAPNMTQMADPLTALMYAVQVMNFLKTLILKTLKERKDAVIDPCPTRNLEPSDENGHESPSQTCAKEASSEDIEESEQVLTCEKPSLGGPLEPDQTSLAHGEVDCETPSLVDIPINGKEVGRLNCSATTMGGQGNVGKSKAGQLSGSSLKKGNRKQEMMIAQKAKGISKLSRVESRMELIEAWR